MLWLAWFSLICGVPCVILRFVVFVVLLRSCWCGVWCRVVVVWRCLVLWCVVFGLLLQCARWCCGVLLLCVMLDARCVSRVCGLRISCCCVGLVVFGVGVGLVWLYVVCVVPFVYLRFVSCCVLLLLCLVCVLVFVVWFARLRFRLCLRVLVVFCVDVCLCCFVWLAYFVVVLFCCFGVSSRCASLRFVSFRFGLRFRFGYVCPVVLRCVSVSLRFVLCCVVLVWFGVSLSCLGCVCVVVCV